jgi:predicted dehydrogenase
MNVAVIGYGMIGKERVKALKQLREEGHNIENIITYDPYISSEEKNKSETLWVNSLKTIDKCNPDWIIISVPHGEAPFLIEQFALLDYKILAEKPFCRSFKEAYDLVERLGTKDQIYIGFNYRFYKGIAQAVADIRNNVFGDLISINLTLAHGGSPGDNKTWKLNRSNAGDGVFLDLGVHLLDLLLQTNHNIKPITQISWNSFWNTDMTEEVHTLFTGKDFIVNTQVSIVRWANTFRMEINGKNGYGIVSGRGKNYGEQTYIRGKRWAWKDSGLKQRETEELVISSDCLNSFHDEMDALLFGNKEKYLLSPCNLEEALNVMELYSKIIDRNY